VSVAKETGQTAATVVWQNIVKMYSRMLPQSLNNAVWIVAPDVLPELFTMALQVGVAGSAIYIQNGAVGAPMTLLGRPVIVSEKASKVGTAGDISFVDLSYYLVGDRQALEVAQSEHVNFATDKTAIRFIQRVDGKPWILSAITPANGSTNTLSPFVNLATRA
jgi:HK97 family phage major capsid protein